TPLSELSRRVSAGQDGDLRGSSVRPGQTSRNLVAATADPTIPANAPATMSTSDVPRTSPSVTWNLLQMPPPATNVGNTHDRSADTIPMPIALPTMPCTRPSVMNGTRMNQFV